MQDLSYTAGVQYLSQFLKEVMPKEALRQFNESTPRDPLGGWEAPLPTPESIERDRVFNEVAYDMLSERGMACFGWPEPDPDREPLMIVVDSCTDYSFEGNKIRTSDGILYKSCLVVEQYILRDDDDIVMIGGRPLFFWHSHPPPHWWNPPSVSYDDSQGRPVQISMICAYVEAYVRAKETRRVSTSTLLKEVAKRWRVSADSLDRYLKPTGEPRWVERLIPQIHKDRLPKDPGK